MSYASQAGRARTSPKNPQAHAICDRCGERYNFVDLKWQYDWRGSSLQNLRILVCSHCYDAPQQQLRAIVLPADPLPIVNARPENFVDDSTDYLSVSVTQAYDPVTQLPIPSNLGVLVDQSGNFLTGNQIGVPDDLDINALMPLNSGVTFDVPLNVLSVTSNGTTLITVTTSSPHGLSNYALIAVAGLLNPKANGFYNVTVVSATTFTYQTSIVISVASMLTPSTVMVTAFVGTPYGYYVTGIGVLPSAPSGGSAFADSSDTADSGTLSA
jgi:hypothetical protein